MPRFLMAHSLLSSWLYAMKDNPYEDSETERDPFQEFMAVLRREPTPTTEAQQKGIDFETLVTALVNNSDCVYPDMCLLWYNAASKIADIVRGGVLQYKAKKEIQVSGIDFLLYGRLDALKAGVIYDIKFSSGYEKGKFLDSTQHPTYLELIPSASQFTYLVSNGANVWEETYWREETQSIKGYIEDFVSWLTVNGLMETYKKFWKSKY